MIEDADIERLCSEFLASPIVSTADWCEQNNMSADALSYLCEASAESLKRAMQEGGHDLLVDLVSTWSTMFRLGWEVHRQYGRAAGRLRGGALMTDRRVNDLPIPPADDPTLALAVGPLAADLCECEALCTCDRIPWLRETEDGFRIEDPL